ncbi:MAG: hypothetical protein IKR61_08995 [Lachnospiraceae bacterium]|nr:hypothetical protein [Lachnospiraceae bacterium]
MAKKTDNRQIVVDGYAFAEPADAALAESERKKIEYLKAHIDSNKPETVLALYQKMIGEKVFRTPIGLEFLRDLREYLIDQADYDPQEVPPIPLYLSYADPELVHHADVRKRVQPAPAKKQPVSPLFISVVLNLALAAGVAAMFWIATTSENPNILNYETAITNRYSAWEQQLTEKEIELRGKERALRQKAEELGIAYEVDETGE